MMLDVDVGGRTRRIEVRGAEMTVDGRRLHVDVARRGHVASLIVCAPDAATGAGQHGRSYDVSVVERAPGDLVVHVNGRPITVRTSLPDRGDARRLDSRGGERGLPGSGPQRIAAPMPGRIAKVLVKVGDQVAARQGVVVVEAMKMENELRASRAGTVTEVLVADGARVEAQAVLVVIG